MTLKKKKGVLPKNNISKKKLRNMMKKKEKEVKNLSKKKNEKNCTRIKEAYQKGYLKEGMCKMDPNKDYPEK